VELVVSDSKEPADLGDGVTHASGLLMESDRRTWTTPAEEALPEALLDSADPLLAASGVTD